MDFAFGIYRFYAARHHIDFWFAKLRIQCVKLAICIADANVVEVNEGKLADAGTGESFDSPGTDTAKANDTDMRTGDSRQAFRGIETCQGIEAGEIGSGVRLGHVVHNVLFLDSVHGRLTCIRSNRLARWRMSRFS